MQKSLGLIETQGLAAGIEAADAAVKSANVELVGYELTKGGGWTTIKIQGDVGAVKAAVDAARIAANKVTRTVSTRVIARPSAGLDMLVHNPDTVGDVRPEPPKEPEPPTPPEPPKGPDEPEKVAEPQPPQAEEEPKTPASPEPQQVIEAAVQPEAPAPQPVTEEPQPAEEEVPPAAEAAEAADAPAEEAPVQAESAAPAEEPAQEEPPVEEPQAPADPQPPKKTATRKGRGIKRGK